MTARKDVRILLVEDHVATRELMREHLETDTQLPIVAETGDGGESVKLACRERPEIVLMDLSLPRMNGLRATELIRREFPETRVIVFTQRWRSANEQDRERLYPLFAALGSKEWRRRSLGRRSQRAWAALQTGFSAATVRGEGA
jgi:CheY-like chemotaxis protein